MRRRDGVDYADGSRKFYFVGKGSVWNWGRDPYRPYLPELIEKINACAKRVQPALRAQRRGKVAMLYPYLYARGRR